MLDKSERIVKQFNSEFNSFKYFNQFNECLKVDEKDNENENVLVKSISKYSRMWKKMPHEKSCNYKALLSYRQDHNTIICIVLIRINTFS